MAKTTQRASVTQEIVKVMRERIKTGEREPVTRNGQIQYRKDGKPRTRPVVKTRTHTEVIGSVRSGNLNRTRDTLPSDTRRVSDYGAWRYTRQADAAEDAREAARVDWSKSVRKANAVNVGTTSRRKAASARQAAR